MLVMSTLVPPSEPLPSAGSASDRSALPSHSGQTLKGEMVPDVLAGLAPDLWHAKVQELRDHKEVTTLPALVF